MKTIKKSILLSALILSASIIQAQTVNADTISTGSGNRIHFINTKANSGSDAILLESNGHYALIDMGEDYDFRMERIHVIQIDGEFLLTIIKFWKIG